MRAAGRTPCEAAATGDEPPPRPRCSPGLAIFEHALGVDVKIEELEVFLSATDRFLRSSARRRAAKRDYASPFRAYRFEVPLPAILYSSVVVAVVSLLETEARVIAAILKEATGFPLEFDDLYGSWPEKLAKFAQASSMLEIRSPSALWQDALGVVAIRNCLVHSGGYLPASKGSRRRAESFVRRYVLPDLSNDFLVAGYDLAMSSLSVVNEFLQHVYSLAQQQYPAP